MGAAGILLGLTLGMFAFASAHVAHGSGQSIGCADSTAFGCGATTTPAYLVTGSATTTLATFYIPNASNTDLNFYVTASSSSSRIVWTDWYSFDDVNWYAQSAGTAFAGGTTYTAPAVNNWTPGASGSVTINTKLSPVGTKYLQIRASATGANLSVYTQAIEQNQIPN